MLRPYQLSDLIKIQAGLGVKVSFYTSREMTAMRFEADATQAPGVNAQGQTGVFFFSITDEASTASQPMGLLLAMFAANPKLVSQNPRYEELLAHCVQQTMSLPILRRLAPEEAIQRLADQLNQLQALSYDPFQLETDYEYLHLILGDYEPELHPVIALCTRFDISRLGMSFNSRHLAKLRRIEYESISSEPGQPTIGTFPYHVLRQRVKQGTFRFSDWTNRLIAMIQMDGTLVDSRNERPPRLIDDSEKSLFSRVSYRSKAKISCRATVDENGLPIGNELSYRVFASLPAVPTAEYREALVRAMSYAQNPNKQGSCGYGLPVTREEILARGCDQLELLRGSDNARQVAWILDSIDRLRFSPNARRGVFRLNNGRSTSWLLAFETERTGLHPLMYLIQNYDLDLIYEQLGHSTLADLEEMEPSHLNALVQPHWLLAQTVMPIQFLDQPDKYRALTEKADPRLGMKILMRDYPDSYSELPQWYLDGYARELPTREPASIENFVEKASDRAARAGSYVAPVSGYERGGLMSWAMGNLDSSTIL